MSTNLVSHDLHPDASIVESNFGLSDVEMDTFSNEKENIGKSCVRTSGDHGLIGMHGLFKVIGLQRFHDKSIGYRVVCIEYPKGVPFKDNFGSCAKFSGVRFV